MVGLLQYGGIFQHKDVVLEGVDHHLVDNRLALSAANVVAQADRRGVARRDGAKGGTHHRVALGGVGHDSVAAFHAAHIVENRIGMAVGAPREG